MRLISLLFLLLVMSGCAADSGSLSMVNPVSDETVLGVVGDVKDASVQKEMVYFAARTARDNAYAKMYKQSGFDVKFEMKEIQPGVFIQVMSQVSFKEAPKFAQNMPEGPSIHPAWKTAEKLIDRGFGAFEWWTAITGLVDFGKKSVDHAAPQYYGDYNPQTAEPFIVYPEVIHAE